ncbi:MAG: hypothetical protein Q7J25_03625 [Vicinamibacterales bacterium]|nr:hypothetical protein [Vicinamibacterales bacterium]
MSTPRFGRAQTSNAEELTSVPGAEVLGTVDMNRLIPPPDDRPPWEVDASFGKHDSDARRYVDVPVEWELRWLNPRLIDQFGMRYWEVVSAADPRVRLKVPMLRSPENDIRRGGPGSDILCFMLKSWVESRTRWKAARNARNTQSAVDRSHATVDAINRGEYGSKVSGASVVHPTHTIADGRSMKD